MRKNVGMISLLIMLVSITSSCEEKPTTRGGVEIDFLRIGNGEVPIHGDVLSLNMTYAADGKELFNTMKIGAPVQIMFDTTQWRRGGLLYEVLELLEIGDSVQFEIPAKNLYEISFQAQVPDSVGVDSDILFNVSLQSIMSREEVFQQEVALRMEYDTKVLDDYFAKNEIDAQSTESGLRYVIHNEGSGPKAQTGEIVFVHYEGTLLNGEVFDSSYGRGEPFSFYLGYGRVIRGWDEGIALLNKGSKATLYVPSPLAYGQQGAGGAIKPNSILKFDVELVDIKGAPAN